VIVLDAAYVLFQTSAAREPNAVRVLDPDPQTAVATAAAETLLSAEIEAAVASGEVAVVIAPVMVDVAFVTSVAVARPVTALVTLAAVAKPETSDTFAREPVVRVPSVRLRVPYAQTCEAERLLRALIEADVAKGEVAEVTPAEVARPEVAVVTAPVIVEVDEVTFAEVARPERSPTARVLVPLEEIVVSILSLSSLPILPVVVIPVVRAFHTCAADRLLSPEIEAAVASGEVAEVNCALVAKGEVADVTPALVASGLVAVVIAPVIVDVDVVTLVAVARPEVAVVTSDTFASEPEVRVLSVKLRVP